MKTRFTTGLLSMLAICLCIVSAYSQEDMTVIETDVFDVVQREAVPFAHDDHNEMAAVEECNECHHVYEEGRKLEDESSEDQRCADCHDQTGEGSVPSLMNAYHRNCKGCHLAQQKGPVMCGECHVKM